MSEHPTVRHTKALIAAISGVAILTAGSTFALWHKGQNVAGWSIVSGDVNLESVGDGFEVWDVSTPGPNGNRLDQVIDLEEAYAECGYQGDDWTAHWGHEILGASGHWSAVPVDSFLAVVPLRVTMQGDNLITRLSMTADLPAWAEGEELDLAVMAFADGFQSRVISLNQTLLPSSSTVVTDLAFLKAAAQPGGPWDPDQLDDQGLVIPVLALPDPVPNGYFNLCVAIKGTFQEQKGRDHANEILLDWTQGVDFVLEQVRDVGHFS
ncbi:MAG: hypothetical protein FWD59_08975 [Micrococcales bacterium]|nr:hypothetical protein [Micrococcales bacterium]